MSAADYALLFAGIGVVLLIAEVFIPSHATLGAAGLAALLVAVGFCFGISSRTGFTAFALLVILTPVGMMAFLKLWPRTYVGRRMTLASVGSSAATSPAMASSTIRVGDQGAAITELRPVGVCDFSDQRVESISDRGMIARGSKVVVVAIQDGRPVVRGDAGAV